MAGAIARGQIFADRFIEGQQAHGVALLREKVGERRGEGAGVVGLGVAARAEGHRAAVIDEQVAAQVRLVLELS